jgi:hypothetical protein
MVRKPCFTCGNLYEAKMPHAKYCSTLCKRRGQRGQGLQGATVAPEPSRLVEVVSKELELSGVLDTVLGQLAVLLAEAFASPMTSAAGMVAVSKELERVRAKALGKSTTRRDPLDELKARRDAKLGLS